MLDRWSVSVVTTGKGGFRKSQKDRQLIMNNYLGIGVDGQVALDFHKVRAYIALFRGGVHRDCICVVICEHRQIALNLEGCMQAVFNYLFGFCMLGVGCAGE